MKGVSIEGTAKGEMLTHPIDDSIHTMTSLPQQAEPETEPQSQNPNPNPDDENQALQKPPSQPQSPEHQTLETPHPQNPEQSEVDQTQSQRGEECQNLEKSDLDQAQIQQEDEEEEDQDDLQVLDQGGDQHRHREPQVHSEKSGTSTLSSLAVLLPPITDPNPTAITSPTNLPRRPNKRKKGGNKKKQQAIEKKLQTLAVNLKPVPFVPSKILDFEKHEKLLRRLGLWDFVHMEFDRNMRGDLIAQLIANYDSRLRCSYVNEFRIGVNRADLARALKLPVKKDKGSVSALSSEAVDLDSVSPTEESIAFVEEFVSNWVLLHEDTWMMPSEVLNWTRVIKDGHPEKVDWPGLIWFMVEKELMQGQQLQDCYYASHLHHLIKSQREGVFWEEPKVEAEVEVEANEAELELELEVKEEENGGEVKMSETDDFGGQESHDNVVVDEPNIELTLGQEIVEKEEIKDVYEMDTEEAKEEDQTHWLLDGKNDMGDHFMQPCGMEDDRRMDGDEEGKPEEEEEVEEDGEEEEVEEDGFDRTPKGHALENDGLTGNFLQGMETDHIPFRLPGQLCDRSNMELLETRTDTHTSSGGPSFFGNGSKREIEHVNDITNDSLNGSNKRLRTNGPWDHKSSDFEMCMEHVEQLMGKARMIYAAKEQACEELNMSQQYLLTEMQRREHVIEHLHKTKCEELQRKDAEIFRLERELYLMGNLLDGYRKAVKETNKAFAEYRLRTQLPEEPLYKDAGPGGVVLSTMELEKQRLKQEEEDRLNRIIVQQKAKEFEEEWVGKMEAHLSAVQKLDRRLIDFEDEVKLLKELSEKRKVSAMSEGGANE